MVKQLILVLALCAIGWASTPTVSQKTIHACAGSVSTCATASLTSVTGHAMAVSCESGSTSTTLSITDGTNTYTAVGTANTTQAANGSMRFFVAKNITGVSHVITCNSTVSSNFISVAVYELAGASTTSPVDVPSTTTGASGASSATPSFTLPTTTFNNDLLIFSSTCANTCAADAAADAGTSQNDGNGDESETYAKTSTGTYTGQFTQTAGAFIVVGVAITDGNGGGGATCNNHIALMGAGCN